VSEVERKNKHKINRKKKKKKQNLLQQVLKILQLNIQKRQHVRKKRLEKESI